MQRNVQLALTGLLTEFCQIAVMLKRKFRILLTVVGISLPFASLPQLLQAQYENGSVVGSIRDTDGAAIAGASVTVTNTATGVSSQTTADSSGGYDVPELRVGVYSVNWVPRNTRDSYVESYYLAIQRQLFKNTLVDVAYLGNHA